MEISRILINIDALTFFQDYLFFFIIIITDYLTFFFFVEY